MFREKALPTVVICFVIFGCSLVGFGFGVGAGMLLSTAWYDTTPDSRVSQLQQTPEDFDLFWQVWDIITTDYVEQPVTETDLYYGAISGLASAVDDPYTIFSDPELTKKFNEAITGEFEGVGIEIDITDGQIVVIAPLAGTPAATAGILAGDAIIQIDQTDTAGMTLDEAISLIRGPAGTTVTLSIYRVGAEAIQDIAIQRAVIDVPSMTYELQNHADMTIGVITMSHIDDGAAEDFTAIAQQVLLDAPAGMIIDLRNNPGGVLADSISIASQFITEGTIVTEQYSDGSTQSYNAEGSALLADISQLVLLVNQGSASAAEIVTGALQDYDRAVIIGTATYGKGSIQDFRVFPDGSSLKLTVAHWLTPLGSSIDDSGITPDIVVERTLEDYQAGRDPQFERAVQELIN